MHDRGRLNNAQVNVGDDKKGQKVWEVCGKVGNTTGRLVLEITCAETIQGRYVKVFIPGVALTLCEVQVLGNPGKFDKPYLSVVQMRECWVILVS